VTDLAKSAKGEDENGYRIEFIKLVESSSMMAKN
jgi:Ca-activated chloride channel family protein